MTDYLHGTRINRRVVPELACETCHGTGTVTKRTESQQPKCSHCGGRSLVTVREDDGIHQHDEVCPHCWNTYQSNTAAWTYGMCPDCHGTGLAIKKQSG